MNNSPPINRPRGIRLIVLLVGGVALFFGLWTVLNNFHAGSVPKWSHTETAIVVGLCAFGLATILGETIPTFWPRAAAWSHRKHFTIVGAMFGGLFLLQYFGVRLAINAHVG